MAEKILRAKFRTGFRTNDRIYAPTGDGFETTYKPIIDSDGNCDVVPDTKINFYEMIQSHKDGTDLHTMIARYENGDVNALNQTHGMFADMTTAPTSLIDFYNRLHDADIVFHKLPVEIQQKFDNNALKFWAQIDTGAVANAITEYNIGKSEKKKISSEVITGLSSFGSDLKDGEN